MSSAARGMSSAQRSGSSACGSSQQSRASAGTSDGRYSPDARAIACQSYEVPVGVLVKGVRFRFAHRVHGGAGRSPAWAHANSALNLSGQIHGISERIRSHSTCPDEPAESVRGSETLVLRDLWDQTAPTRVRTTDTKIRGETDPPAIANWASQHKIVWRRADMRWLAQTQLPVGRGPPSPRRRRFLE